MERNKCCVFIDFIAENSNFIYCVCNKEAAVFVDNGRGGRDAELHPQAAGGGRAWYEGDVVGLGHNSSCLLGLCPVSPDEAGGLLV